MSGPLIYVRDPDLNRVALLDDYKRITAVPKFNDVGSWELVLDHRQPEAALLMRPNYGLEVVLEPGITLTSGPTKKRRIERAGNAATATLTGISDEVWLSRRIAHMQPGTAAPPYSAAEHDVRTGACSTVLRGYVDANAGPGALAERRVPLLTLATDPLVGTTITGRARLQVLLEYLQELALSGGGIGFRLIQSGTQLRFETYQPVDRSQTVKFSDELGNLGDYSFESEIPEATYVYCGGGGEGTARTFIEGSDAAALSEWGRFEMFRDRRDTTTPTEMTQSITEELAGKTGKVALTITPFDTPQQSYGKQYWLGDKVTVMVAGEPIVEQIRAVTLSYDANGPLSVKSEIGTPGPQGVLGIFRRIADLRNRVTNIERR